MTNKYKEESELLKAIAHPMRLKIIELLLLKPLAEGCNVNAIQKKLTIPQSTISQHLQILKNKGIIIGSKTGTRVCYRVIDKRVSKILKIIKP